MRLNPRTPRDPSHSVLTLTSFSSAAATTTASTAALETVAVRCRIAREDLLQLPLMLLMLIQCRNDLPQGGPVFFFLFASVSLVYLL